MSHVGLQFGAIPVPINLGTPGRLILTEDPHPHLAFPDIGQAPAPCYEEIGSLRSGLVWSSAIQTLPGYMIEIFWFSKGSRAHGPWPEPIILAGCDSWFLPSRHLQKNFVRDLASNSSKLAETRNFRYNSPRRSHLAEQVWPQMACVEITIRRFARHLCIFV